MNHFWLLCSYEIRILIFVFSSFASYVGIREVMFGGSEFKNWKENLTSEDAGFSTHRI